MKLSTCTVKINDGDMIFIFALLRHEPRKKLKYLLAMKKVMEIRYMSVT